MSLVFCCVCYAAQSVLKEYDHTSFLGQDEFKSQSSHYRSYKESFFISTAPSECFTIKDNVSCMFLVGSLIRLRKYPFIPVDKTFVSNLRFFF